MRRDRVLHVGSETPLRLDARRTGGRRLLRYCGLHHRESVVPRVLEEWLDEASSGHPFFRAVKGPGFRCCKDE